MKFKGTLVILCLFALILNGQAVAQTPEELLSIQRAQLDAMNAHDLDTMMTYWAEDSTYHLVNQPTPKSKAALKNMMQQYIAYYPDFQMTPVRALAAGNVVVSEEVTVGSNPAFGLEMHTPHISIFDFEGDKIKKVNSYNDNLPGAIAFGKLPAPVMPDLVPSTEVPDPEPTGLSPMEANAELIARWNSHDAALVAKMDHADVQIYADPLRANIDRVAMMALNELYFDSFPDDTLDVVRAVDMGDGWVLTELISRATHMKSFLDVPASGYPVEVKVAWLTRYDLDGLVIEMSFYYDNMVLINHMKNAPWPLDGIWITSSPTPFGNYLSKTLYTAQNAAKTLYSGTLEFINGFPLFAELYPDADPSLSFSAGGQAVMVARNKYEATYLSYDRKYDVSTGIMEIVGIDTLKAYFEVTGPDQIQGYGTASYYMAAQDVDQDGFPDEGEEPVACFPWEWTSKRLTEMSECTLAVQP
jgi:hypothetical protein